MTRSARRWRTTKRTDVRMRSAQLWMKLTQIVSGSSVQVASLKRLSVGAQQSLPSSPVVLEQAIATKRRCGPEAGKECAIARASCGVVLVAAVAAVLSSLKSVAQRMKLPLLHRRRCCWC
jgi:hypothetical protein